MVSIDLDNIIHYHSPPIPKPPCKPPRLITSSHGSSNPPSIKPFLNHPLPPRPPCFSHKSLQKPHTGPQSPSPVVSCLPSDRNVHLNEFDKELADLDLAEIESQETLGLCFGGSERSQAENINGIQRKEVHDTYCTSQTNDRRRDDLPLSQDPDTPQGTTASNAVESGLSSAVDAPASPMGADGPVSRDELCPIQNPSSTERRGTQLSLVGCETEVNSVAVGEPCQTLTSQHDCNVSRDQFLSHNPSASVLAGGETEPASQRLFRWSPEAGAETSKSSLPHVIETPSIQLQSMNLSTTRDSPLEVRSHDNEIRSTDCHHSDEALSNPASPVLQQQEQASPRSQGEDPPRNLSRSCSVSVVVTRSQRVPITSPTRPGHTPYTSKRKRRAKSPSDIDSDDPDDSDYTDGDDSGVGDIVPTPRAAKRQRRTTARETQSARVQHESPHRVFSSPAPEEAFANPYPATSLQDMQTIPVRGFLTRQTFLSRVVYSCTFEEDRQARCPHRATKAPAYDENLDKTGHTTQACSKKPSAHATRFLPHEDDLLVELKEKRRLPWNQIVKHFQGRTKGSLQVRYSTRLKVRGTRSLGRGQTGKITRVEATAAVPQEECGILPRARMASQKAVDPVPLARQRYGQPRARHAVSRYSPG